MKPRDFTDKKTTEYTEDIENKNSVNSVPSVVNLFSCVNLVDKSINYVCN